MADLDFDHHNSDADHQTFIQIPDSSSGDKQQQQQQQSKSIQSLSDSDSSMKLLLFGKKDMIPDKYHPDPKYIELDDEDDDEQSSSAF